MATTIFTRSPTQTLLSQVRKSAERKQSVATPSSSPTTQTIYGSPRDATVTGTRLSGGGSGRSARATPKVIATPVVAPTPAPTPAVEQATREVQAEIDKATGQETAGQIVRRSREIARDYNVRETDVIRSISTGSILAPVRVDARLTPQQQARSVARQTIFTEEEVGQMIKFSPGESQVDRVRRVIREGSQARVETKQQIPTTIGATTVNLNIAQRITRQIGGAITSAITRGKTVYPEQLKAFAARDLPILYLQQVPTNLDVKGDKSWQTEQRLTLKQQDRAVGRLIASGKEKQITEFAVRSQEQLINRSGDILLSTPKEIPKQVLPLVWSGAKTAVGFIGTSTVKSPATTAGFVLGFKALTPVLAIGGSAGLTGLAIGQAETPKEKLAVATTSVAGFIGYGLVRGGIKGLRRVAVSETIKTPLTFQQSPLTTRPLTQLELLSLRPVAVKGLPSPKIRTVTTIKKERFSLDDLDELAIRGGKRADQILDKVPISDRGEFLVPKGGVVIGTPTTKTVVTDPFVRAGVKVLGAEFVGVPLTKVTGIQLGTQPIAGFGRVVPPRFVGLRTTPELTGIPLSRLAAVQTQPKTALGVRASTRMFDIPPAEIQRLRTGISIAKMFRGEKGLPVSSRDISKSGFTFEGLSRSQSKTLFQQVEIFTARGGRSFRLPGQAKGEFFGSTTVLQIPKGYRRITLGDIDVKLPIGMTRADTGILKLAKTLQKKGLPIETPTKGVPELKLTTGQKVFEAKPKGFTGGEQAPEAFAGMRIGVSPSVPFGKAKATSAGEQLLRKTSATLQLRPTTTAPETPKTFSQAGFFPKEKRFKDLPDFVTQSLGIVRVRETVVTPRATPIGRVVFERQTAKGKQLVGDFFKTFSPTQQKELTSIIKEQTKGGIKIEFGSPRTGLKVTQTIGVSPAISSTQPAVKKQLPPREVAPRLDIQLSPSPTRAIKSSLILPSLSPSISSRPSPSISPRLSPSISPSISPRPSPSISPRPSPSISPSISPRPSPSISPRLSPSISPSIPPRITTTPRPRITLRLPSLSTTPRQRKAIVPQMRLPRKYKPSLVGLEFKIKSKKPKDDFALTGLEIRAIAL